MAGVSQWQEHKKMGMLMGMQFAIPDLNWLLRVIQIFGRQTFPISR